MRARARRGAARRGPALTAVDEARERGERGARNVGVALVVVVKARAVVYNRAVAVDLVEDLVGHARRGEARRGRGRAIALLASVALQVRRLLAACGQAGIIAGVWVRGRARADARAPSPHAPVATSRFHFEMMPLRSGSMASITGQLGPCSRYESRSVRSAGRGGAAGS